MSATVFFQSANEIATLTKTFTVDGSLNDPTTTTLDITAPSGVLTSYNPVRALVGTFTQDVPCVEAGTYAYVWTGTGPAADVTAGTFTVYPTALGGLYATVELLKGRLGIPPTDTVDNAELTEAVFTASRALEAYCERVFWRSPTATARTFEARDYYELDLPPFNDLVSVTAIRTDATGKGLYETAWDPTDWQLAPFNPSAAPELQPFTMVRAVGPRLFPVRSDYDTGRIDRVEITGIWGWPAVPYPIRQAALAMAAEVFKSKDAPLGIAGFGDLGVIRVQSNPIVARLADPYCRGVGLA